MNSVAVVSACVQQTDVCLCLNGRIWKTTMYYMVLYVCHRWKRTAPQTKDTSWIHLRLWDPPNGSFNDVMCPKKRSAGFLMVWPYFRIDGAHIVKKWFRSRDIVRIQIEMLYFSAHGVRIHRGYIHVSLPTWAQSRTLKKPKPQRCAL